MDGTPMPASDYPVVGRHYSDGDGRRVLVWGVTYESADKARVLRVMLEDERGQPRVIGLEEWLGLINSGWRLIEARS